MALNILKLSVGTESVDDLTQWHRAHAHVWAPGTTEHVTRMWPKREEEILNGGSLYWVIIGVIQARQRLVGLAERRGQDGILRCALVLDGAVGLFAVWADSGPCTFFLVSSAPPRCKSCT